MEKEAFMEKLALSRPFSEMTSMAACNIFSYLPDVCFGMRNTSSND